MPCPASTCPRLAGLDLGCKNFGVSYLKEKICLVMDVEQYRYQRFISDIAGQDIYAHGRYEKRVINTVRNWLRRQLYLGS